MRRRTLDYLLSWVGVLLTVALLGAGALLMVGYSFDTSSVTTQLRDQNFSFPAKTALVLPAQNAVIPFAGQQVLTGPEAQVFANDVLAVHLKAIGGGKTYSEVSAASLADPTNTALANQADLLFKGTTLQGSLLTAYAFWTFGVIALWSSIACFILGALMLMLTLMGFRHYTKVDPHAVIAA